MTYKQLLERLQKLQKVDDKLLDSDVVLRDAEGTSPLALGASVGNEDFSILFFMHAVEDE